MTFDRDIPKLGLFAISHTAISLQHILAGKKVIFLSFLDVSLNTVPLDLAEILGTPGERRRWVVAEWGGVYGGVFPPQPTRIWGVLSSQRGPGQSLGRKRILAYFEGNRTLILCTYMTKSGGTMCINVPTPNSGGTCPPP